jgi:Membrane proteins related to metalloendopeptidases
MVKFSPELAAKFPALGHWLRNELPLLPNDPAKAHVWDWFKYYAQIDDATARDALAPEAIRCPALIVADLGDSNGCFLPDRPNEIQLARDIAVRFEADSRNPVMKQFLESTVLHELVHWGDQRDGLLDGGVGDEERGRRFEVSAYGEDLQRFWSDELSLAPTSVPDFFIPAAADDPTQPGKVTFARLSANPAAWPVRTADPERLTVAHQPVVGKSVGRPSRAFGAPRDERFHAGVDLAGSPGDEVCACEAGIIVAHHRFLNPTDALLVACDSGFVINYGEVEHDSWRSYNLSKGSRVEAGQPIARIGKTAYGAMLHFEMYRAGTLQTYPWFRSASPPSALLNPTAYLLALVRRERA